MDGNASHPCIGMMLGSEEFLVQRLSRLHVIRLLLSEKDLKLLKADRCIQIENFGR
jgi:hypothetical protein